MNDHLYKAETTKSADQFAKDFEKIVTGNGLMVGNSATMDMAKTFGAHGADVPEAFDVFMIQVCNAMKAAKSMTANPERVILMPKFVMVFSKNGTTQIRFFHYNEATISAMVPDDDVFPGSLAQTYKKIISMIEEAR